MGRCGHRATRARAGPGPAAARPPRADPGPATTSRWNGKRTSATSKAWNEYVEPEGTTPGGRGSGGPRAIGRTAVGLDHLLGEGLRAGGEVGVAAVDRADGVQARDREEACEPRVTVGVERDARHHRVAHQEVDGTGPDGSPWWNAARGRERYRLPHRDRAGRRRQGRRRRLAYLLGEGPRAAQEVRVAVVDGGDDVAARDREPGRELRLAPGPDRDGPQDHVAVLECD